MIDYSAGIGRRRFTVGSGTLPTMASHRCRVVTIKIQMLVRSLSSFANMWRTYKATRAMCSLLPLTFTLSLVPSPTPLPGVSDPLGMFDPVRLSKGLTPGRFRFYREAEMKHARVAMLAAAGFPVAEQFHPLFGGQIDAPSYIAFQASPLQAFWPAVLLVILVCEVPSLLSFNKASAEAWSIRADHEIGNFNFDPLNLKPESEQELIRMQTKELNNGRLAMLAITAMVLQEMTTGQKLF